MNRSNKLFEPFQLGSIELKNRIVMAPMTRGRADGDTHVPTEIQETYYEQRASAGLIISEGTVINEKAHGSINIPAIYNEAQIAAWKKITDKTHAKGAKIFAQIWHVGRISHPDLLDGDLPIAPSAINPEHTIFTYDGVKNTVTPRALSLEEILQIEEDFTQAALNAVKAGFDGVEIHAANSYLIHQFLADSANQRHDNYGGTAENKARFLFETLDKVVRAIGADKVGIRLSPHWSFAGIEVDEALKTTFEYVVANLNSYNLAFLHLTGIGSQTQKAETHPTEEIIETVRNYRKYYPGTVIINGGFDKTIAQQVLEEGVADLVSFGIQFLANPDLVERLKNDDPLNNPDTETLYYGGEKGFIDYPIL